MSKKFTIAMVIIVVVVVVAALVGLFGLGNEAPPSSAPQSGEPQNSVPQSSSIANQVPEEELYENAVKAEITMENGGTIVLELYPNLAPITVDNFVKLANEGFYDGLTFHRIVKGFMIQGGDPNGDGTGGPGHTIKGEFASNGWNNPLSHTRGVISMARSNGNDTAGSQFFIVDGDASFLDGQYAAFGKVTDGLDVVDEIAATPVEQRATDDQPQTPLEPVVIASIKIIEG